MSSSDDAAMVAAAKQALALSEDCPEAYVLLTYDKPPEEGKPLLEKALSLAGELLGQEILDQPAVDLCEVEDGPAYLLARKTLGFCHARLGDEEGALEHLTAVATLDPKDRMSVGHTLIISFLTRGEAEDDERAWRVATAQSGSGSPYHLYSRALLSHRRDDPEQYSHDLLREALLANPHVPMFLLGLFELPESPPTAEEVARDGWLFGETAAGAYASAAIRAWAATPGALEWMQESMSSISGELKNEIRAQYQVQLRAAGVEEIFESLFDNTFRQSAGAEEETEGAPSPAWVFVCRQPEAESLALARYREGLEMVLREKAAAHELRTEYSELLAGFRFFTVVGEAPQILDLVADLMEDGIGGFLVCTYRGEDEAVFEALGAEVVMKETGPPLDLSEYFSG